MKKVRYYIVTILLFLLAGSFMNTKTTLAASAEIEITTDSNEVVVGDNLFVYITINSETSFGDFEANLTYDDEILEYQEGASFITGSSGFLKISDTYVSEGDNNRKYILEFKSLKVGSSEIGFSGRSMVYDFDYGNEMSVSSNILTVNVKAAVTASDNAFLKSLKISPSQLNPAFDKSLFEYETSVGYETQKLVIEALTEDNNSIVQISGNDSLKEGENKIIVTVLAESGAVIEYTIDVFREFAPEVEEEIEEPVITPGTKHGTFEVVRIDGELFAVYGGKYHLVEPDSEVKIPSGYVSEQIILSSTSIKVYVPEKNRDSDFLLIYAENELGEAGFYQYDKIERTLQRYVPDSALGFDVSSETNLDDIMSSKEYRSNLMKAAVIITLLSVLCALLIVVSIRLFMKMKGYREDDLD